MWWTTTPNWRCSPRCCTSDTSWSHPPDWGRFSACVQVSGPGPATVQYSAGRALLLLGDISQMVMLYRIRHVPWQKIKVQDPQGPASSIQFRILGSQGPASSIHFRILGSQGPMSSIHFRILGFQGPTSSIPFRIQGSQGPTSGIHSRILGSQGPMTSINFRIQGPQGPTT